MSSVHSAPGDIGPSDLGPMDVREHAVVENPARVFAFTRPAA